MEKDKDSERFPSLPWHEVVERVEKSTFRIYTDNSMGSGFLVAVGKSDNIYMATLASAWHVVEDLKPESTLKIFDNMREEIAQLVSGSIAIFQVGEELDSAIMIVRSNKEIFSQKQLLPIISVNDQLKNGAEIG